MKIEIVPVLQDNYAYLVICENTGDAVVIDPGEAGPVFDAVKQHRAQLKTIWCTHHHPDHIGGNGALRERMKLDVVAHEHDQTRIDGVSHPVKHGDSVSIGNVRAEIIHTPGHTLGGIAYLVDDAVFTGDTLFAAGCGRLFEGDPEMMYCSLHEQLLPALKDETQIFCGHEYTEKNLAFALSVEPNNVALKKRAETAARLRKQGKPTIPTGVATERATNPFLRCENEEIQAQLAKRFPADDLAQPKQVFRRLRELRDSF